MLCGVASVTVSGAELAEYGGAVRAAEFVWTRHTWKAALLGGPVRGTTVCTGFCCPDCEQAYETDRVVGPSLVIRACAAGWERQGRPDRAQLIRDLGAEQMTWAAVVAEAAQDGERPPAPPATPWAFQTGWPDEQPVDADPVLAALRVIEEARRAGYEFPSLESA
jgi:hypothetical protein